MAKLKPVMLELLGNPTEFPIKCTSDGIFSTIYPSEVLNEVTTIKNYFKTRDDLVQEIIDAVNQVNSTDTIETDLIFYDIENKRDSQLHNEILIGIKYIAVRQIKRGKSIKNRVITKDIFGGHDGDGLPKGWMLLVNEYGRYNNEMNTGQARHVPFTVENMKFFEELERKIKELGDKMNEFLQPQIVQELSASNELPLLIDLSEI